MKTSELTGAALDWAVAKALGLETRNNKVVFFLPFEAESDDELEFECFADSDDHAVEQCEDAYPNCTVDRVEWLPKFLPSTDWSQAGPIIEREKIATSFCSAPAAIGGNCWIATYPAWPEVVGRVWTEGPTPLIAAMRCFVASKLGEEVEVPDELT